MALRVLNTAWPESVKRKTNAEKLGDLYVSDDISLLELEERMMGLFEAGAADEYTDMQPLAPPKPGDAARSVRPAREITPHIPWEDEACMQCLVAASD